MSERSRDRFTVYSALVKIAGQADLLQVLDPQLDQVIDRLMYYVIKFKLVKVYNKCDCLDYYLVHTMGGFDV